MPGELQQSTMHEGLLPASQGQDPVLETIWKRLDFLWVQRVVARLSVMGDPIVVFAAGAGLKCKSGSTEVTSF